MESLLSAELSATCSALGHSDGNKYYPGDNCRESAKDLIIYLRRDDVTFETRRQLGESQILETDLLPMLEACTNDTDVFDIILRLLANLTTPVLMLFNEKVPTEKTARNQYLQILGHLTVYKKAFASDRSKVWEILRRKMSGILEIDAAERDEDQTTVIERCLIVVRNVLSVPADVNAEKRPDNDASLHDELLWSLHISGILDLILYLATSKHERDFYLHIVEIMSLMLREQNPGQLAKAVIQRSVEEKRRDSEELSGILEAEKGQRQHKVQQAAGFRHSRFGGTYVVKDVKSISEQDQILHKPLGQFNKLLNFDAEKKDRKTPKNRIPIKGENSQRTSAFSIRLFLKEFCVEFLTGAYNHFMSTVKSMLDHQSSQENDESYFLWAIKFFMAFNRYYGFKVDLVSETMNVQIFHFVTTQLNKYLEMMTTDKVKIPQWSRRMHAGVSALKELLSTLEIMDNSEIQAVRKSSTVIQSNVFYTVEYRESVLTLMLSYSEFKFSNECLIDLVEVVHTFLKLLERFSKRRSLVVQTSGKKKMKKKSKQAKRAAAPISKRKEELWTEIGPELSAILQSPVQLPDSIPFDATSEKPIDDQKGDAMRKIQAYMHSNLLEEAIGMLRASREVWPENDSFGRSNMAPEEEFISMQDIFMADLGKIAIVVPIEEALPVDSSSEEEEGALDVPETNYSEASFKFDEFEIRFANPTVVRAYSFLLASFKTNQDKTNHCVAKMLHRMSFSIMLCPILFQATIFVTFRKLLKSTDIRFQELRKLARYVFQKFGVVASKNGKVYMETLFWKTKKDAHAIETGEYNKTVSSSKVAWAEEEEEELRHLHREFLARPYNLEKIPGGLSGWVRTNIIRQDRSAQGINKKLRELGLMPDKVVKVRPLTEWGPEELEELADLYNRYKDYDDPIASIREVSTINRPKKHIVEKLVTMGLIEETSNLLKKCRAKVPKNQDIQTYTSVEMISGDDSSTDGDDVENLNWPEQQQVIKLVVKKCMEHGGLYALAWLIDHLMLEIDERIKWIDSNDAPDTILAPDDVEIADKFETTSFRELFKAIGFIQDVFLKVPSTLGPHRLREFTSIVSDMISKSSHPPSACILPLTSDVSDRDLTSNMVYSHSDDDENDINKSLSKITTQENESEIDMVYNKPRHVKRKKKNRAPKMNNNHDFQVQLNSSSSDDETTINRKSEEAKLASQRQRALVIDDDDDSKGTTNSQIGKRQLCLSSDDEEVSYPQLSSAPSGSQMTGSQLSPKITKDNLNTNVKPWKRICVASSSSEDDSKTSHLELIQEPPMVGTQTGDYELIIRN